MRLTLGILAWLAFASTAANAQGLPIARDLAADGRDAAETKRVVVVLYSIPDCPWCKRVRNEYLVPMTRNADEMKRIVVREVESESRASLRDFAGADTTPRAFANAQRVRFVPHVAFYGPGGDTLAEPLVGFRGADFYGAYLDQRIETALGKLK